MPTSHIIGAALVAVAGGLVVLRRVAFHSAEKALITVKQAGSQTPADVGLEYEELGIQSGDRHLVAWFVRPRADVDTNQAVLVFHGRNESISDWVPVQRYLAEHGITSMVFDYSGFGDSSGRPSAANLRQDVQAAYRAFDSKTASSNRTVLLGYSLGTGFLLEGVAGFDDSFDAVVLIAPYSCAREVAVRKGVLPARLTFVLPDVYDNVRLVRRLHRPLLVVHSADDLSFPVAMAEEVVAAANEPKRLVLLSGPAHEDLLRGREAEYLAPALAFLAALAQSAGPIGQSAAGEGMA